MTSPLHEQRFEAVLEVVRDSGAGSVLDLGCGEGDLLVRLAATPGIDRIVGLDPSGDALGRARARLDGLAGGTCAQVALVHGSATDAGTALAGFDCALLVETIEHIEPERLSAVERSVFAAMRPTTVVITTPNADYNPLLDVPAHRFRHRDHRFEWSRAKFRQWAQGVAARNGYTAEYRDIAGNHPLHGGASQMAVFRMAGTA